MPEQSLLLTRWTLHDFEPDAGVRAGAHLPDVADAHWLPVSVPGDVHSTLVADGRLPDPFYDQNELTARWVEDREWWYRTTFEVPEAAAPDERWQLVFHGLDTFAAVYLNGVLLSETANMFRVYPFDVTGRLREGHNVLAVRFDPPLGRDLPSVPDNWAVFTAPRVGIRKAQFGYGWDWGPRLPTIGLWRPVEVRRQRTAALGQIRFDTLDLDVAQRSAVVSVRVEAERVAGDAPLSAHIVLLCPDGTRLDQTVQLSEAAGGVTGQAGFVLSDAHCWWTHDLGEPSLYTLQVALTAQDGKLLDQREQRVGIRQIVLDRSPDPDEPGANFFRFVLNGVPLFAKGACWIPADSLLGRLTPERYRALVGQARDANMTMLRVWGGGLYEHEAFYDACDELGLLVWQDFMFACAPYPETPELAREVEAEARDQVARLRNRACLALWCGNNENQWIHERERWQEPDSRVPGTLYYDQILPTVVAELDGRTPYWPGSPYGGNDHNSMLDGDRHNWEVWHGNRPMQRQFGEPPLHDGSPEGVAFTHYAEDLGRFISEFGMHAAPARSTLLRVLPEGERFYHSPAFDHHNKDSPKNKGDHLMATVTGVPSDLDAYLFFSQATQAEGLKFAVEHYRRRTPHCSGTLVWQFNDCWPGLSWSVVDYDGVPKPGYWALRRAYAPRLASLKPLENGAELWLINDTREAVEDELVVRLVSFTGEIIREERLLARVEAHQSRAVLRWALDGVDRSASSIQVCSTTGQFERNRLFLAPLKDLRRAPPLVELESVQVDEQRVDLTLSASSFAYLVTLSASVGGVTFEDNSFELWPGEVRHVRAWRVSGPLTGAAIALQVH